MYICRRNRSKKKCQQVHAVRRFIERTGLVVGQDSLNQIVNLIRNGKSIPIRKQSLRVSVHQVTFRGKEIRVVYDKIRKQIVTVLPLNAEVIENPVDNQPEAATVES